ncbi:DUF4097 family beta strand repeat-containing protein [Cesiribacter andamanensis]|uniref:Uncharacterized protein n=1 Tax=Cesiribacter andamanensis AMV16 TaxID=1279009 RepID=M7NVB2_9BACT|nr:hypothetical protein [Cesiribacter andamanensis]EMR02399.1 hypothetical protein ADICEAN_02442 [Cesiribacter andamanensis AMV16]
MKTLFFTLLLLAPLSLPAQKILEERWPLPSGTSLNLKLDHGKDILLRGWDKPEVQLRASILINGGTHNDALTFTARQEGGVLKLVSELDEKARIITTADECDGQQFSWNRGPGNTYEAVCLDVTFELWVPHGAAITLKTISGNVTATNLRGALDLNSISGFIDLSWPASRAAAFWLKSITGELYTDLDFQILNKKEEIPIVGYEMRGQLGQGGTPLRLETISSNIYVRKE